MQTINLNQNSFRLFPTIYMVQNDTGRELKMILDDVTLAGTETGAVAIKRSDGSYYTISATIDTTNNAFDADMTQALTQPSRTECQLKVTRSGLVVSSYTFCIMVQPSTDGINEAQLGYSVQQLRQDALDIRTGGMPADLRLALLQIAQKVAYIDDQGAQYYQDLYDALAPSALLTGITAVYTQSGTVYDTDSLDSLKADLVVTASYSDGTTQTLLASEYTLSGTLEEGTSTITVSYEGKTDDFNVTVSVRTIKVFNGKGTSGTSIIDNANRALSEMIPVSGLTSISTANPNLTDFRYAVKFTAGATTVESTTPSLVPDSYTGTGTALSPYDTYTTTTETLFAEVKQNQTWVYLLPSSNYIRLLFKKDSEGASPITSLDGATIVLNGVEYKIVEKPAGDFE